MRSAIVRLETSWLDADVEAFMYRQLFEAFGVHKAIFVTNKILKRKRYAQVGSVEAALNLVEGRRIFLEPTGAKTISDIPNEKDLVFIVGNTQMSNAHLAEEDEMYRVKMRRPDYRGVFGVSILGAALGVGK
jgi:hypothetical protein